METKTKTILEEKEIQTIIYSVFGDTEYVVKALDGGLFNQIYLIEENDNRWILKVAPPQDLEVLQYERQIILNEIFVYKQYYGNVPNIPKLIHYDVSKTIVPYDFMVVEFLEGTSMVEYWGSNQLEEVRNVIYPQLMDLMAQMHQIETNLYGYYNQKLDVPYEDVVMKMFYDVIEDGIRKNVVFPYPSSFLIDFVTSHKQSVTLSNKASVLHFDLWDGNLLIKDGKITGVIDLERSFCGDPIADFVPLHFDIFDPKYSSYVEQYNNKAKHKLILNKDTRQTYLMYKLYLRLIMVVECSYRGVDGSFDEQYHWAYQEIIDIVKELKESSHEA